MILFKRLVATAALFLSLLLQLWAQGAGSENSAPATPNSVPATQETKPVVEQAPPDKRILGVLPNYRTANETAVYTPITAKQKFTIASKDSFDYPLVALGAAIAGIGQWANSDPSFGQGAAGFARRFGTSYADQAIGNIMTEGLFPSFLHEDPRYFRRGTGKKWGRAYYAATRVFVTHTDAGTLRFNYSEVLGNAAGVAISTSYEPDGRSAGDAALKLGEQIGIDAASQVLKEFWPDLKRKFFHHHADEALRN
jgi:hypothetical protein